LLGYQFFKYWWQRFHRSIHQYRAFVVIAFIANSLVLISCVPQINAPLLRVGIPKWIGFTPFQLAEELQYYQDTSIRLLEYPSGPDLIQAFRNGEVEVMGTTMGTSMLLSEADPTLKVILVTDSSHGADVILSKPSIASLKDLAGQRIGLEASEVAAFMLNRALEQVGLSVNDVQLVLLSLSEQETAFEQGKVDALVTYDPTRSHLLALGAKQLFDSSQIPGEIVDVIIARDTVLSRQQRSVQSLVNGWFKAHRYFQQRPKAAASRIAPLQNLSSEEYLNSLKGLEFPNLAKNQQLLGNPNSTLIKGAKQLSEIMQRQNLLKTSVDPASLIDDRFVKNLKL
jgi:NitT/TauT family transport system substrate-binding protein